MRARVCVCVCIILRHQLQKSVVNESKHTHCTLKYSTIQASMGHGVYTISGDFKSFIHIFVQVMEYV